MKIYLFLLVSNCSSCVTSWKLMCRKNYLERIIVIPEGLSVVFRRQDVYISWAVILCGRKILYRTKEKRRNRTKVRLPYTKVKTDRIKRTLRAITKTTQSNECDYGGFERGYNVYPTLSNDNENFSDWNPILWKSNTNTDSHHREKILRKNYLVLP